MVLPANHRDILQREREAGGPSQGADDGALLMGCFPGQPVGAAEAVCGAALAALTYNFDPDAVALGQGATGFSRTGDFGAGGGSNAGIRVDVQHGSPLSRRGSQMFESVGILHNGQSNRILTIFRDLAASQKQSSLRRAD